MRLNPSKSKKEVAISDNRDIRISEEIAPKMAERAFLFTPRIKVMVVTVKTTRDKKERITGLYPFRERGIRTFQIKRKVRAKDNTIPPPLVEEKRRRTMTNIATRASSLPPLQKSTALMKIGLLSSSLSIKTQALSPGEKSLSLSKEPESIFKASLSYPLWEPVSILTLTLSSPTLKYPLL